MYPPIPLEDDPPSGMGATASMTGKTLTPTNARIMWEIMNDQYELIKMVAKGKHKKSETVESNNVCKLLNDILEAIDHEDAGLYECSGKGTVYIPRG